MKTQSSAKPILDLVISGSIQKVNTLNYQHTSKQKDRAYSRQQWMKLNDLIFSG